MQILLLSIIDRVWPLHRHIFFEVIQEHISICFGIRRLNIELVIKSLWHKGKIASCITLINFSLKCKTEYLLDNHADFSNLRKISLFAFQQTEIIKRTEPQRK